MLFYMLIEESSNRKSKIDDHILIIINYFVYSLQIIKFLPKVFEIAERNYRKKS